jgi:anti-sigma factor RsiW
MDCRKLQQDLSRMIDGELDPALSETVTRHFEVCPECRNAHAQMVDLDSSLKAASAVPRAFLAAKVKQGLAGVRKREEATVLTPAWNRLPLMAMIALLALGLGNLAGRSIEAVMGSYQAENPLEIVMSDPGPSLADTVMELGQEENGQ